MTDVGGAAFRQAIDRDIMSHARYAAGFFGHRVGLLRKLGILLTPGMLCTLFYRVSHWLWLRRMRRLARLVAWLNFVIHKAAIDPASSIGPGLYIPHTVGIIFSGNAGAHLTLYANAIVAPHNPSWFDHTAQCPALGDGVTIGAFAVVLGAVSLGDEVKIGPGVVCGNHVNAGASLISGDHVRARPPAASFTVS